MIKKLTSYLDYGIFAEIAVTIFSVVFVALVIRTLMTNGKTTTAQAMIVLDDVPHDKETNL